MRIILVLALSVHLAFGQDLPPPNGIRITDSLYLDATEIANIHWLEYEYSLHRDSSFEEEYIILPQSQVTSTYRPDYYRDVRYRYYPLVGITQKQALRFCRWRTKVVNNILKEQKAKYRVRYRLPSEKEWELAAQSLDSLRERRLGNPMVYRAIERDDNAAVFALFGDTVDIKSLRRQIKKQRNQRVSYYVLDYPRPWFFISEELLPNTIYFPDYFVTTPKTPVKFYQMIGNVAEMVAEPGIVKGGSWRHKLAVSFPSKRIFIDPDKAYDWVGFRCIAEILPTDL